MWPYLLPLLVMCILASAGLALIMRHHRARNLEETFPMYVHRAGERKWAHGHAVWVHDVLAFRARAASSPATSAAWYESLFWVTDIHPRAPTSEERWWVHHMGGGIVIGTVLLKGGGSVGVAVPREYEAALFIPPSSAHTSVLTPAR